VIRPRWIVVCTVALAAAGCAERPPQHEVVTGGGDVVRIARAEVDDGSVHFFSFPHNGTNVNFLVRTDGLGALHVHLDACFSCFQYRRGFVVEDDDLVCIACRLEYPIADELWDFIGACAPIPVHATVDADNVLIPRSMLEKAARYF